MASRTRYLYNGYTLITTHVTQLKSDGNVTHHVQFQDRFLDLTLVRPFVCISGTIGYATTHEVTSYGTVNDR